MAGPGIEAYPIPNLINGISQQAPQQRRDTQGEDQLNCMNSPVDGCVGRTGTTHKAWHELEDFSGCSIRDVNRSDDEQYRIVIGDGFIRVFDLLTGVEGIVNVADMGGAAAYLNLALMTPKEAFRALTIEDSTFITNREEIPAMVAVVPPDPEDEVFEAFIYFRSGDYLSTYTVDVDYGTGTKQFFIQTLDNSQAANYSSILTGNMASAMFDELTEIAGDAGLQFNGFTITRLGNIIRLRRTATDGGDFKITSHDDANNDRMIAIKGHVQRFAQLPNIMWNGTVLAVRANAENQGSDYYVLYEGEGGGDGSGGVWIETAKPGIETDLDADTMPHQLVSIGNNEFNFGPIEWSTRIAGDGDKSAKDPGFIGKPIKAMTWFRDRLGLMHAAGIALSKTSQPFTFFPDTVQTALETDPIDVRVAHTEVAILESAIAHNEQLFLWADDVQFAITSQEALTQKTIEINPTTNFDYSRKIDPIGVGDNVIFTFETGGFTNVAEQFATVQGIGKQFADITSHVPKYVPKDLLWMAGTTSLNLYAMSSSEHPNRVFVYNYFVIGEEKKQSAWAHWDLPPGHHVLYGSFSGPVLRLCIQRVDGTVFEELDCSPAQLDPGDGSYYLTRLDRRITEQDVTWTFVPPVTEEEGTTEIILPYVADDTTERERCTVVTRIGSAIPEGEQYRVKEIITEEISPGVFQSTLVVWGEIPQFVDTPGDMMFFIGWIPSAEYEFSRFFPKDERGAFIFERIQVKSIHVTYAKTGWTRGLVTINNGRTYNNIFAGRVMGSPTNILGKVAIETGTFRVPVKASSDKYTLRLINDSPFPSSWQTAEVHYRPTVRARRSG